MRQQNRLCIGHAGMAIGSVDRGQRTTGAGGPIGKFGKKAGAARAGGDRFPSIDRSGVVCRGLTPATQPLRSCYATAPGRRDDWPGWSARHPDRATGDTGIAIHFLVVAAHTEVLRPEWCGGAGEPSVDSGHDRRSGSFGGSGRPRGNNLARHNQPPARASVMFTRDWLIARGGIDRRGGRRTSRAAGGDAERAERHGHLRRSQTPPLLIGARRPPFERAPIERSSASPTEGDG